MARSKNSHREQLDRLPFFARLRRVDPIRSVDQIELKQVADRIAGPTGWYATAGSGKEADYKLIGLLLGPPPAPDLLMSEDGRVLGLRDERGMVHIASARTDRFVSDAWARRQGQEGAKRWTVSADEQAAGLGCATGLCRWRKGPWRIALVSDDRRLAEACSSADIVLSTVDAQGGRCRGPRLVIDRRDAWREGAQALWLDELGVRRETANARRGDRPWVPNSSMRQTAPVKAPGA